MSDPIDERLRQACEDHIRSFQSLLYSRFYEVRSKDGLKEAVDWLSEQVVAVNQRFITQQKKNK